METVIGQIKLCRSLKMRTTRIIKCMERLLSSSRGPIEMGDVGVCRESISDIAKRSWNCSLSACCHIRKSRYTGPEAWKQHPNNSKMSLESKSNSIFLGNLDFIFFSLWLQWTKSIWLRICSFCRCTHGISVLAAGGACEVFKDCLKMTTQGTLGYTLRSLSSEFACACGGHDVPTLEMPMAAEIEGTQTCTWRPWPSVHRDALRGRDWAILKDYLELVDGRCAGFLDSIHPLVRLQPWEPDKVILR